MSTQEFPAGDTHTCTVRAWPLGVESTSCVCPQAPDVEWYAHVRRNVDAGYAYHVECSHTRYHVELYDHTIDIHIRHGYRYTHA